MAMTATRTEELPRDRSPDPSGQPRRVTILGSTGSIGQSTVDLLSRHRDQFTVEALTAHHNAALLAEQASRRPAAARHWSRRRSARPIG
jgi:1-deoxy-D-xylulose 5-phosphate reductoisomerase